MKLDIPPGHPVDTFLQEIEALRERIHRMRQAVADLGEQPGGAAFGRIVESLRETHQDLANIDVHFLRKEGLLFPCLERHGITGPSTVMWGIDDQIRDRLVRMGRILREPGDDPARLFESSEMTILPALEEVERVLHREERDLLPMALDTLREEEWAEIWRRSDKFGWCLVRPREGYQPPDEAESLPTAAGLTEPPVVFPTGRLTPEQLRLIYPTLPLDFTFIDADDRVRFYSLGPDPIFPRAKSDLGQKVEDCHPPKSVPLVKRILSDFRSGKHDVIDSWITHEDKFAHIRYFAIRDSAGGYVGTLEMVQDIKPLRALEGEVRLAQYHGK